MNWARFRRLIQRYPLAGVRTVRSFSDTQRTRDLRNRML
jgi:hypothetical protein